MIILAQIAGVFAIIALVTSYQQKNKKKFLGFQMISNIFYALQYIFLFAWSGVISSLISTARTIDFYRYENKKRKTPVASLIFFIVLTIIAGILTIDSIYAVIPIAITIMYTYGTWQKKLNITFIFGMIAGILWTIYSIMVGAYVGIIGSVFEFISSLIGYIRFKKRKK